MLGLPFIRGRQLFYSFFGVNDSRFRFFQWTSLNWLYNGSPVSFHVIQHSFPLHWVFIKDAIFCLYSLLYYPLFFATLSLYLFHSSILTPAISQLPISKCSLCLTSSLNTGFLVWSFDLSAILLILMPWLFFQHYQLYYWGWRVI